MARPFCNYASATKLQGILAVLIGILISASVHAQSVVVDQAEFERLSAPEEAAPTRLQPKTDTQVKRISSPGQAYRVTLAPLSESEKRHIELARQPGAGPQKIGVPRGLDELKDAALVGNLVKWESTPTGGRVTSLEVEAPDAIGLRLGLAVSKLPDGAKIRFFDAAGSAPVEVSGAKVNRLLQLNKAAGAAAEDAITYWSPTLRGSRGVIEIELPAGVPASQVEISIPRISHLFATPISAKSAPFSAIGTSSSCNLDAVCYPAYSNQAAAVGLMGFVSGGTAYTCTGTLMNDKDVSTFVPYFLTANHCISTQAEASTLETYWNWQSSACNSGVLGGSWVGLNGGARLLFTTTASDTTFLVLNDSAPGGAIFTGWSAATQAVGSSLVGVHHPHQDLTKISFGSLTAYASCTLGTTVSCSPADSVTGTFIKSDWQSGLTEGGSSGSGLWATISGSKYLIGTLTSGTSGCTGAYDFYGRFSVAFNTAIQNWLTATTAPFADLAVSGVTSPSTGTAGGTIAASAVVKNQGGADAAPSRTEFFLSSNNIITTLDVDTGYGCDQAAIVAGGSRTCSGNIVIPASMPAGTYYLGAIADANEVLFESSKDNNSAAASNTIQITAGARTNGSCGSAANTSLSVFPTANLCSAGSASAVATNAATYDWTCSGIAGGTSTNCSAARVGTLASGTIARLAGHIKSTGGVDLCAMVLINGNYMFSCSPYGDFDLQFPVDSNGLATMFIFVSGMAPQRNYLTPALVTTGANFTVAPATGLAQPVVSFSAISRNAATNTASLSGTVTTASGIPLCAMVLANGQYMFSCDGQGSFALTPPLDANGMVTLFAFVDGMSPYTTTFQPQ